MLAAWASSGFHSGVGSRKGEDCAERSDEEEDMVETKRGIIHTFLTRYRSGGTPLQFASARDQEALRAVALRDWGQPQP
ncbi:hypothetical protein QYE76_071247 [Lolium multiflorum]|uniref:Uncharacterized protein n=1 Tax=Lolium multiflorum TaxID=4521 RepID=A0AAD8SLR1_LOLMU|nr:hypothetical protein QYE76_071247 [Lolium multiflorum]